MLALLYDEPITHSSLVWYASIMKPVTHEPESRRRSYPWHQVAGQGWHEAVEGEDYTRLEIFRSNLAGWASRNGYKYKTTAKHGSCFFTVWKA